MENRTLQILSAIMLTVSIGLISCRGGEAGDATEYNLAISSTEGGSVAAPGEGTFAYDEGTVVNLVAEPGEGYRFENWTGDVSSVADVNAASTTITMNSDYTIAANFVEIIEIRDWYDLDAVRDNMAGNYALMNELESGTPGYGELASPTANEGKGWQPIGTYDEPFTGVFYGQGYEIRDLFVDRPHEEHVGLFGFVDGVVIQDVGVVNFDVTGGAGTGGLVGWNSGGNVSDSYAIGNVTGGAAGSLLGLNIGGTVSNSYANSNVTGWDVLGGLVGWNEGGTVINSYATGSVTGEDILGGLVGWNEDGTVSNSHSTGGVTGDHTVGGIVGYNVGGTVSSAYAIGNVTGADAVGGLVGYNLGGPVGSSYATGSVTGQYHVGGLVGYSEGGTVINSCATSNVTGTHYCGGLMGHNDRGYVNNSYSTGSVTGDSRVGGLLGWNSGGIVSNSYAVGNVTGDDVGGLVGYDDGGTVTNSFWDTQTGGQDTSDGGTGKTTPEMKSIATFSDAGWNIIAVADAGTRDTTYTWNIVDGETYPCLSWQPVS